jgi:hypothetical protein
MTILALMFYLVMPTIRTAGDAWPVDRNSIGGFESDFSAGGNYMTDLERVIAFRDLAVDERKTSTIGIVICE